MSAIELSSYVLSQQSHPWARILLLLFIRLGISHTDVYAFVDCIHLLSDTLGEFCTVLVSPNLNASANHKKILSLLSSGTQGVCCGFTSKFNHRYLTWQPFQMLLSSVSKRVFPYLSTTNRPMNKAFCFKYPQLAWLTE